MARFKDQLAGLVGQLEGHPGVAERLGRCRTLRELERLEGWLEPEKQGSRLKLVRHGSGTFLVVSYEDGWSTRVAMQDFPRRG